ncbi:oligosaccharide flippase family protein [Halomonas sp. TRM85114]|uniref:lipopolysaccharide biosynthesis protein n=1 Tax=Halomonas jincaotanensis TaxID=2810616 RepID=UPI001BD35D1B|nr:oligosaccharide flippase family protein [Halomonas jincaotanensis]MBS9404058.1 oligosaccharide flippase family protein [Halomonas jincaotanensis]
MMGLIQRVRVPAAARKEGLFSGAFIYLFSNILNAAIPFLILPILTRNLEPSEYGQVAMFQTLIAALTAFVGLNAMNAATRKYYDDINQEELAKYIGACLQILAVSGLLVLGLLYALGPWIAPSLGISTFWVLMAVLVAAGNFVMRLRLGQWQVRKKPLHFGAMQISMSLINALLSIYLVVVISMGPEGRMTGQLVAPLLIGLLGLVLLYRDGLVSLGWHTRYIKDALAFGVPLIPHVGGIFLLTTVDRFFVNKYLGLEAAGVYMVAVQLAMAMGICFDAFNKAYVPWLFERLKRDDPAQKRRIVKGTYGYFVLAAFMALLAFLLGPYVVVWMAGERYAEAGSVLGLLAIGQAFQGMYLMVTNYIFYAKRTGRLSLATIGSGLFNIALMMLLTPIFGLHGAAAAFAIAMGVRFLATWFVSHKSHPMPWFTFHKP